MLTTAWGPYPARPIPFQRGTVQTPRQPAASTDPGALNPSLTSRTVAAVLGAIIALASGVSIIASPRSGGLAANSASVIEAPVEWKLASTESAGLLEKFAENSDGDQACIPTAPTRLNRGRCKLRRHGGGASGLLDLTVTPADEPGAGITQAEANSPPSKAESAPPPLQPR